MNRADFMNQLERLLQGIAPSEREEAIQYYNDYFDDAGEENEKEVIEALGNPAKVAENIRRDLLDSGYGKKPAAKAKASDRALMEYGKNEPEGEAEDGQGDRLDGSAKNNGTEPAYGRGSSSSAGNYAQAGNLGRENADAKEESARKSWNPFEEYGKSAGGEPLDEDAYRWSRDTAGWFGKEPKEDKKGGLPAWAIPLLVIAAVFLVFPFGGGLLMGLAGVLAGWFGTILGLGIASVVLLGVFVALVVAGIVCLFLNPWVGMALVGGGLLTGCIGLLLLMLTVAMAGIVTPAIIRGLAGLFRFCKGKIKAWTAG